MLLAICRCSDHIKEDYMGGACDMHGREVHTGFCLEALKEGELSVG
jgi:hypothetical protein